MKSIIDSHNKRVLQPAKKPNRKTCNCNKKNKCPLNGNCLAENTVYEAEITTNSDGDEPMSYVGLAETTFKKRYANHKKSFNIERYENETELSKSFWKLKRKNKDPKVTWKIIRKCKPINKSSMKCNLCLSEKLEIALRKSNINHNCINARSELISKCRHVNKYALARFDTKD